MADKDTAKSVWRYRRGFTDSWLMGKTRQNGLMEERMEKKEEIIGVCVCVWRDRSPRILFHHISWEITARDCPYMDAIIYTVCVLRQGHTKIYCLARRGWYSQRPTSSRLIGSDPFEGTRSAHMISEPFNRMRLPAILSLIQKLYQLYLSLNATLTFSSVVATCALASRIFEYTVGT